MNDPPRYSHNGSKFFCSYRLVCTSATHLKNVTATAVSPEIAAKMRINFLKSMVMVHL